MKTFFTHLWSGILNNGVRENLDFDQISRIRISNVISVVGSLFAFSYGVILFLNGQYRMAFNDLLFIINLLLLFLFNYLGYYRIGIIIVFITLPVSLLLVNYEYGRIGTEYFFFAMIVFCFYYFQKPLQRFMVSFYLVLLILITKYLETVVVYTEFTTKVEQYLLVSNVFMSLIILLLSVSLFVNEHIRNKIEIEKKNFQLNNALLDAHQKNEQVNLVLKELSHRVKNNLQMVSSLFNIQAYKTKNSETKSALKDARNRIVSIAIMHQKLYQDNLFHEVMLRNYILDLIEYLNQSVGEKEDNFISAEVDDITLRIEDTVHVGLIINELVTNAIKYGVNKSKNNAEIKISIQSIDNEITVHVADSGNGFKKDFNIEKTDSFGLDLVKNIALQHEGSVNTYNDNGANVEVKLKITEFRD